MADIKQALKWLSEGKKIRANYWDKHEYIQVGKKTLVDECGYPSISLSFDHPWELYEQSNEETSEELIKQLQSDIVTLNERINKLECDNIKDFKDKVENLELKASITEWHLKELYKGLRAK